jgi:hypothetical protein
MQVTCTDGGGTAGTSDDAIAINAVYLNDVAGEGIRTAFCRLRARPAAAAVGPRFTG